MESFSFVGFAYTFLSSPLSPKLSGSSPPLTLSHPPTLLAALYVVHYLNRSLISPLRTPSRSKSHLGVVFSAISVQLVNGSLLGAYLSSPAAQRFLANAYGKPLFWIGIGMWALGMVGNVLHDEVLLDIRRKASAKGKSRVKGNDDDRNNGKDKQQQQQQQEQQHHYYAIPHGYLYTFISYPNYLCEWVEWIGFALAAAPLPSLTSFSQLLATLSPPWLFVAMEVLTMLPRAYRGHQWYRARFPDYPRERKAILPFIL